MKIKYLLEYVSKDTGKGMRSDLGYNIKIVEAAVYMHLKNGDTNVVVIPKSEESESDEDDPSTSFIIDV